uniref:ADP-sugar pyrophosphatase-like isoform X1 n=1 Tax=Styela clava TaxID=7725 RepID=UPI00193AA559|nr:ADP-sugar pyrophosphatase-like isoform X1 [Styela clava]XP_039273214.1 ADP-sugar pyrophosphatase-like isoform X2 [Styela clava]
MDNNGNVVKPIHKKNIKQPNITKTEVIHSGKWLSSNIIHYSDEDGVERQWESVSRVTKVNSDVTDGVAIIPVLKRRLHHDFFLLVKQFRPPIGGYSLEFPGGLIDKKDNGPCNAAIRELYEETGYCGKVTEVFENFNATLDPGVSETTITFVCMEIDGDSKDNAIHQQHLDDGESIEIILFPVRDFTLAKLTKWCNDSQDKISVDSRVVAYALGLQMGSNMNSKKMSMLMDDPPNETFK